MAKSKAKADLLAEVEAIERPFHYRAWVGSLSPEDRESVLEIRRRWQAGKYKDKGIQKSQLHAFLKERLGISIGLPNFRTWLDESE